MGFEKAYVKLKSLGHNIGEMVETNNSVQADSLRRMYLERERLLNISVPKMDVEKLESGLL